VHGRVAHRDRHVDHRPTHRDDRHDDLGIDRVRGDILGVLILGRLLHVVERPVSAVRRDRRYPVRQRINVQPWQLSAACSASAPWAATST
jgi:hypothetical protein